MILKAHASKVCFHDANCYGLSEIKFNGFTTRIVKYLVLFLWLRHFILGYNYVRLRFLVANRNFNESCKVNEQCKGTTNANTCLYKEEGVCSCDKEYSFIDGECLKGKKKLLIVLYTH